MSNIHAPKRKRVAINRDGVEALSRAITLDRQRESKRREIRNDLFRDLGEVVYYLRRGEHVKIGTTTNLRARLSQHGAQVADLMAIEPGGLALEQQRHAQFGPSRVYGPNLGREMYWPSEALMLHVNALRDNLGVGRLRLAIVPEKAA